MWFVLAFLLAIMAFIVGVVLLLDYELKHGGRLGIVGRPEDDKEPL